MSRSYRPVTLPPPPADPAPLAAGQVKYTFPGVYTPTPCPACIHSYKVFKGTLFYKYQWFKQKSRQGNSNQNYAKIKNFFTVLPLLANVTNTSENRFSFMNYFTPNAQAENGSIVFLLLRNMLVIYWHEDFVYASSLHLLYFTFTNILIMWKYIFIIKGNYHH